MVTGFTAEILCMMYTSGDVEEPEILTAELIETLAKEEVRKLCFSLGNGSSSDKKYLLYSIIYNKIFILATYQPI